MAEKQGAYWNLYLDGTQNDQNKTTREKPLEVAKNIKEHEKLVEPRLLSKD